MRFRSAVILVVTLATFVPGRVCLGQEALRAFWHSVVRDTKRNHAWPGPFQAQPRIATRAPFNIMVANGWRFNNMLGEHHFDPDTNEPTAAAKFKIGEILYRNPPQHRSIYVHRGETPDETAERMQAIHALVVSLSPDGKIPPIYETFDEPPLNDSSRVNAVQRLARESIAAPTLPAPAAGVGQ